MRKSFILQKKENQLSYRNYHPKEGDVFMLKGIFNNKIKTPSMITYISTNLIYINPTKPQKVIEQQKFDILCGLIKKYGVLQPIVVRSMPNGFFELVCGEIRLKAVNFLKIKNIPSIIIQVSDADIKKFQLIEYTTVIRRKLILNKKKFLNNSQNNPQELLKVNTRGSKDTRIFINTINRAIEIMKKAGIKIFMVQKDTQSRLEIKIKVEKT